MIKTVENNFSFFTDVWVRCEVSEVWLSRSGFTMEQIYISVISKCLKSVESGEKTVLLF